MNHLHDSNTAKTIHDTLQDVVQNIFYRVFIDVKIILWCVFECDGVNLNILCSHSGHIPQFYPLLVYSLVLCTHTLYQSLYPLVECNANSTNSHNLAIQGEEVCKDKVDMA